jgi:hypothetical protein
MESIRQHMEGQSTKGPKHYHLKKQPDEDVSNKDRDLKPPQWHHIQQIL